MNNGLQRVARKVMLSQSFAYPSFATAMHEIQFSLNGYHHWLRYDRLSLCIYEHNLSASEYYQLGEYLTEWEKQSDKEDVKKRLEYAILFQYAKIHKEVHNATIQKVVRPDFVLAFNSLETVGIEVTRLITQSDSVASKIIGEYYKSDLSLEEIDQQIRKKHGKKAETMRLGRFSQNALWCSDHDDFHLSNVPFVENVDRKISKYKDTIGKFDRFIILCDAQSGITITGKRDAEELLQKIALKHGGCGITIAVLFIDSHCHQCCCEISLRDIGQG